MQLNGVFQQQFFRTNQLELLQLQPMVGKGHQELQLIMKTVMTKFTDETILLIQVIKSKVSETGEIKDSKTKADLMRFINAFKDLINNSSH